MKKQKVDFVIIVLVYRNTSDLEEFIASVNKQMSYYKFRIVVVNSYYDEETRKKAEEITEKNECDFISIENKGYSYGNNCGISFAEKHYYYQFIIVSNPDIIIIDFPHTLSKLKGDIIAPKIITANGKHQNPMIVKENRFSEWMIYKGFKKNNHFLFFAGIGWNKLRRIIFLLIHKDNKNKICRIFAAHGSFLFLSKNAIEKLGTRPYDENMFLFGEETVLALKAKSAGLITSYVSDIYISHKEDGSIKLDNLSVNNELYKSNIYYYENYRMRK